MCLRSVRPVQELPVLEFIPRTQMILRQHFRVCLELIGIDWIAGEAIEDLGRHLSGVILIGCNWRKFPALRRPPAYLLIQWRRFKWAVFPFAGHEGEQEPEGADLFFVGVAAVPERNPVQELRVGGRVADRGRFADPAGSFRGNVTGHSGTGTDDSERKPEIGHRRPESAVTMGGNTQRAMQLVLEQAQVLSHGWATES